MLTNLKNCSYVRPASWVENKVWSFNRYVLQTDRTTHPANLLNQFKLHARIDGDFEDDLLRAYLAAAIEAIELYTGLQINPQERVLSADGWTHDDVLQIHGQPIQTILVTDEDTGLDISADCEINSSVEDVMFYLRPPSGTTHFTITYGCGFYWDAVTGPTIWTVANLWGLLNVWSVPESTLDNQPLIKQAIFVTAADLYERRQSDTTQQMYNVPSITEMLLRPLRRPAGY